MHIVPANPNQAARRNKLEASVAFAREQQNAAPLAYTLRAAVLASGLSEDTLRRCAKRGRLILRRVEGRTLVDGDSLRALIRGEQAAA